MVRVDVAIVGGGIIGSTLALALSDQGFTVALIDQSTQKPSTAVTRVSALYWQSCEMLKNLGIFEQVGAHHLNALRRLVVWDHAGGSEIEYDSADIGLSELGYIIENDALIHAIQKKLTTASGVALYYDNQPLKMTASEMISEIILADNQRISASLIVGADGQHSWLRQQLQIPIQEYDYEQTACVTTVTIEKTHQDTGWQVFLPTGPLALLPLADKHQCSIVWSQSSMPDLQFEAMLNDAFGSRLGYIQAREPRLRFKLTMHHATSYIGPKTVLVGDAAHRVHPLTGQGANMGLSDIAALVDCLVTARARHQDIASKQNLRRYERQRKGHNQKMIDMIRLLHTLFSDTHPGSMYLRNAGINLFDRCGGLKKRWLKAVIGYR